MATIHVLPKLAKGLALLAVGILHTTCFRQECAHFYNDLAPGQQRAEFLSYDREKQVDVYLCGMRTEPPDYEAAHYLAGEGTTVIPILLQRLKKDTNDFHRDALVHVFLIMAVNGELKGRQDVADELRLRIQEMKDETWRATSQSDLAVIERRVSEH